MGLSEWRAKRKIKDGVRGVFRQTSWYEKRGTTWLTGAITVEGWPAFAAEAPVDSRGKWTQTSELPVLVDRSNPNQFTILWEEVLRQGPGAQAQQAAQDEAARLNAAAAPASPGAFGASPAFGNPRAAQDWAREMVQDLQQSGAFSTGSVTRQVFVNGQPVAADSPEAVRAMEMAQRALGRFSGGMPSMPATPSTDASPVDLVAQTILRGFGPGPTPAQVFINGQPVAASTVVASLRRVVEYLEQGGMMPSAAIGTPDGVEPLAGQILQSLGGGPAANGVSTVRINGQPVGWETVTAALHQVIQQLGSA